MISVALVITVMVFGIATTVLFITTTVGIVTTVMWTSNQSHCNDQHYNH